ncbi:MULTISPECIES: hypothetical protein [unclassified Roseitalea]|uniref:hypothetical protein n=1 Tax=unclassified Roseitalea TaxID=2639107 RepID=UPI00273F121D|nr:MULTISPECIES: hypothetical protein [unclassified Roseitalea]
MSMFAFAEKLMTPFVRDNPFIALMPGMEPLQKSAQTFLEDMADTAVPEDVPMPTLWPGQEAMADNWKTMARAMPGVEAMPGLMPHPLGAMAAGSALSMGVASQVMGTVFGTVTGMMGTALKASGDNGAPAPYAMAAMAMANPAGFAWAGTDGSADAPVSAGPAVKPAASADATGSAPPRDEAKTQTKTGQAKTGQTKSGPAKAAPPRLVETAGDRKRSNGAATASGRDGAGSVAAAVPAAEPVATPTARPARADTAQASVAPEDFKRPAKADKPSKPDDLKMIAGVGPKLEQVLNSLGIWTFTQISRWSPQEVAWVDDYLQFKGRIERDDWIAQAAALAKGGREEYVKVFGKEPR